MCRGIQPLQPVGVKSLLHHQLHRLRGQTLPAVLRRNPVVQRGAGHRVALHLQQADAAHQFTPNPCQIVEGVARGLFQQRRLQRRVKAMRGVKRLGPWPDPAFKIRAVLGFKIPQRGGILLAQQSQFHGGLVKR